MIREDFCKRCSRYAGCGFISRNLQRKCDILQIFEEGYEQGYEDAINKDCEYLEEYTSQKFEKGAEQVDKYPYICYKDIEDVAKEVIDVDWQKLQDRLWNMIERNLRAQFIRKACDWLDENFRVSSFDNTKIITHFSSMSDVLDSFREAMKEE